MKYPQFTNFYLRSGVFGLLSLAGAALNYTLYPVLTRILSTSQFGDFAAIISISNQVLGILLAFNIISIYLVKTLKENEARLASQAIQRVLIWAFVIGIAIVFLASPYLKNLLQIQDLASFAALACILLMAIPAVIWTGYLQGHKEMVRVGIYNFGAALGKLVFSAGMAVLFGTIGAIWGVLAGAISGLLILRLTPGVKLPHLRSIFEKTDAKAKQFLLNLKSYFWQCLFVVGVLSFLQNYDITLAKALFDPAEAGLYSGISILSNALYYLTFLLVWILLPEINVQEPAINRRILGTAYKLLAAFAVVVILVELLGKSLLTGLLLGSKFSNSAHGEILIFASLYQMSLVAVTLYAYYLLVMRQFRAVWLAGLVFAGAVILPASFAKTPLEMIIWLWISVILAVASYSIFTRLQQSFRNAKI